jgi:integrase
MTSPVDISKLDPSLLAALKLISERPEVLAAAMTLAKTMDPGKTVGEMWEEWEPWAQRNIASFKAIQAHRRNFETCIVDFPDGHASILMDLNWKEMTPEAAELYRATRERSSNGRGGTVNPASVNRELTSMQSMFNYHLRVKKAIGFNPVVGYLRVSEEQFARKTALTPEQVRRSIEAGPPTFQDIAWVAYRCAGMRNTEARMLRKSEIDWEAKLINLPASRTKARQARVIPFPDDVEPILRRHHDYSQGPMVFVNPRDPKRAAPISIGTMGQWTRQARRDSGIVGFDGERVVLHSLRHSGVTQLINDGAPEIIVKAASGMCDAILKRYNKFQRPQQELLRAHMNRQAPPSGKAGKS